jgi:hypothetical protein
MKLLAAKFSIVALSATSSFAYAGDLYGYLVVSNEGYKLLKDVTPIARNDLLDNWGEGKAVEGDRGYVKVNLNTLRPASNKDLVNRSCVSYSYDYTGPALCRLYENAEHLFIAVGPKDHTNNFRPLSFKFAYFKSAVNEALEREGFNDISAWKRRTTDVSSALDLNNTAENQASDALDVKIRNAETEMNKFQPLIVYRPFTYKKKTVNYPTLLGDLKTYHEEQEAGRQSFAKAAFDSFVQYFEPLKADAESTFPGLLAQQKAEALAKEKAEQAAQANRERQEKLAAIEINKQMVTEAKRVSSFRLSIKTETETNCGPVIGVRGNLIQVSTPVAGYGNEHWVRRNELFPPGYGCWWHNGNYLGTERPQS